ncbi:MAG: molybdopterin-dependent oxidoreductase [Anaerolineales bacterium]
MEQKQPKQQWRLSRREFLIGAGVLGGGVALGYLFGWPVVQLKAAETLDSGGRRPSDITTEPTVWIEISPENQTTFFIPKIEMGQGVHTSLAQILAEELGVAWKDVRVVQADTLHGPLDPSGTTGSTSVSSMWPVMREVAATMREMLRVEAALQLKQSVTDLQIQDGAFLSTATGTRLTFGEVVKNKQGQWEIPEDKPPLKPIHEFTIVGQPIPRVDLLSKLTGEAVFGYDARLPGMLYGAVAQPPTIGAKLRRAGPGDANQPGVVKVVIERDFAGVVAESRQLAQAAVSALELEWDEGQVWNQSDIEAMLDIKPGKGIVIQKDGHGDAGLKGDTIVEAQYTTPFAAHAHLEPQAALADIQPDQPRVWVSTQLPALTRTAVAEALGLKEEQITLIPTYLGGGFGRKYGSDVAVAAAKLSQAVGKPVHVGWTRQEEFQHGYLRPPTKHRLQAKLTEDGRVDTLAHWQSSGEVAAAFVPGFVLAITGDFGAWRGARIHYGIPNRYTHAQVVKLPVRTSWWRGLGLLANVFAVESFMDELAHEANVDPLAFRLQHLPAGEEGERFRKVLTAVAEKAEWATPAPAGRARGLACCKDAGTIVAQVAEVSVDANQIRVHRVTCAIDPGLIVNPDGVKAQTEGAITMGLSSTLIEQVSIQNGRIHANNFDLYPLLTMRDTPDIEVILLQSGDTPHGVGEPPIGPIAGAVGNAVFALTGQRLRHLPLQLA